LLQYTTENEISLVSDDISVMLVRGQELQNSILIISPVVLFSCQDWSCSDQCCIWSGDFNHSHIQEGT